MATASPDNIKQWKFPDGNFIQNLSGHTAIINTLSLNQDNVLVSGGKQCFRLQSECNFDAPFCRERHYQSAYVALSVLNFAVRWNKKKSPTKIL